MKRDLPDRLRARVSQVTCHVCVTAATCVLLAADVPASSWEHRGVVVGLYASDPGFDYGTSLDELIHLHASTVLILVTLHQESVGSPHAHPMTPTERATLTRVLRLARSRGLKAGVIPILALDVLAKG